MRILVVSHVFPGEFGQLAAALAAAGHEVIFAAAHGRREARIPGVRHMDLRDVPLRRPPEGEEDPYGVALAGRILDRTCARARDGARRLVRLRAAGWEPQIVCCSAAHGNGLLARGLFPQAFFVVYGEWYTAPEGEAFAPQAVGNLLQAAALGESHLAFTSTDWQRTRYPEALAQRLEVWPRCVDTAFFSPPPVGAKAPEEELITFSGRGMESPQAFLRLLAGLPHLLERRPRCRAVLLSSLGEPLPQDCPPELRAALRSPRVRLLPYVPRAEYRELLRASTFYVYCNSSQTLSSGLFEAMACGLPVLATDTGAVREVLRHGQNGFLFQGAEPCNLADRVGDLLEALPGMTNLRRQARRSIEGYCALRTELPRQLNRLQEAYARWAREHKTR
ncbi:glycosyltransferase [Desulfovibrio legallii]|jgi:glycosyltransferase involved in cell wall biosynthesis|uniref:Glycosyltransferase involved in cell wall bisynthesis n=1 Tax=Desulfovibrio legallii TaxID=571438 RepID=A0A1G7KWW3_9BACT|nr:glycosyltransferase [Desulfovibrio legallii]SDF41693.1 Glycosyltransferase involved in cell wall bisynthesis [Desulfovibrio legallii]